MGKFDKSGRTTRHFDYKPGEQEKASMPVEENNEASLDDINKSLKTGQVLDEGAFAPVYQKPPTNKGNIRKSKRKLKGNKISRGQVETDNSLEYENLEDSPRQVERPSSRPLKARGSNKAGLSKQELRSYGSREYNKHRVGFFGVMIEDFLNKQTGGNLDTQKSSFEIAYNRIMSEKHTKMVFQILELPMEGVKPGFIEELRVKLKARFPSKEKGLVDVFVIEYSKNSPQNLSSRKNKNTESSLKKQLRAFEEQLKVMEDPSLKFSDAIREEAKSDRLLWSSIESARASRDEVMHIELQMKKVRRKQDSFQVIQQFQASGGHCCEYYIFIEVVVQRPDLLEFAGQYMTEILKSEKMEFKEILDLNNYQKSFGVSSLNIPNKKSHFDVIPFLATSNVVAISSNFRPGIIRDHVCEMYMGNQIANNYRFDIGVTGTGKAENYMLFAQTGSGKSAFVATSLFTAMDNPYMNIIIKDYKGEYAPFANIFPNHSIVLSTGIGTGAYINTYVIPDYRRFGFEMPLVSYLLASNITIKTLTALASRSLTTEQYVADVCTDIVDKVYRLVGVRQQEPSTYHRSTEIDYVRHTMYALQELMRDSDVRSKYSLDILQEVHTALVPHFGFEGIKGGMYRKPIDMEKVLFGNRIIVMDKGTQSVGGSQTISQSESRAQSIQEYYIDNLYTALARMNGNTTIIVTEEIQQRLKDELLLGEVAGLFTGGRSANIVNIGISSTASAVYDSKLPEMDAIRESLTGLIIGRCDALVVDTLIKNTKISNIQDSLMRVSQGKGSYEFSFLIYSLTGKTDAVVTRMPVNQIFLDKLLRNKKVRETEYNFKY